MKRVMVVLTDEKHLALKRRALERGVSMSVVLRKAVEAFLSGEVSRKVEDPVKPVVDARPGVVEFRGGHPVDCDCYDCRKRRYQKK